MNALQVALTVEAVLILIAMGFGWWVSRKKNPYGKVKLGIHIFFFLWMTMGYVFIAPSPSVTSGSPAILVLIVLMGVALTVQLTTGLIFLFRKLTSPLLPRLHLTSASVLLAAVLVAWVVSGAGW